ALPTCPDGECAVIAFDQLDDAARAEPADRGNDRAGDAVEPARKDVNDLAQKLHRKSVLGGSSASGPWASSRHDTTRNGSSGSSTIKMTTGARAGRTPADASAARPPVRRLPWR